VMAFDRTELEPFRVELVPNRDEVRVCPVGELDIATVPLVEAELGELWSVGFARLVLDLRGLCFLDSSGLRMLLEWQARSSADGVGFSVIPGPPEVERVIELAGVADQLEYASPARQSGESGRVFTTSAGVAHPRRAV
jgi:anti-sigma B factor antagonist